MGVGPKGKVAKVFDLTIRIKNDSDRGDELRGIVEAKKSAGKYKTLSAAVEAIILEYADSNSQPNGAIATAAK